MHLQQLVNSRLKTYISLLLLKIILVVVFVFLTTLNNISNAQTIFPSPNLTGTAGGDLSGTYPNPTVSKVNNNTPGGTCGANTFATSLSISAVPTCTQPSASNLSNGVTGSGIIVLATNPTITNLNVSTVFTATGLVKNTDLVNAFTSVNGQTCTLGSSCTVATGITLATTIISGGGNTKVLFDNSGLLGEYTISGTGNVAMTTNPIFTTPNVGTPSAATLTNAIGLPLSTGVVGTLAIANNCPGSSGASNTTFLRGDCTWNTPAGGGNVSNTGSPVIGQVAQWTSATVIQGLATTGTGSAVLATSPTLVTPALGTPSAVVLTNATGLPVSTGISGLGTGVATFLATPSSANLASAITDETGSGALVLGTSPTLITPNIGVATATSVNGNSITAGTGTLTLGSVTLNAGAGGTLGSNAFTSTAYAPLASPTFTGTVTHPTPFTLGAISVTSTGTQLNYLNAATGTTGTTSTNIVFSTSPTLVTPTLGAAIATSINGAAIDNLAWTSYSPTATCSQSTGSAVCTATGNYQSRGKTTCISIKLVVSGTFTGGLFSAVSLPVNTSIFSNVITGGEVAVSGLNWKAYSGASQSTFTTSDATGAQTIATGYNIYFTGCYQTV